MVSFLVKPKWLQLIPQSWGMQIGCWWMALSHGALVTCSVAAAVSEVDGTWSRRWRLVTSARLCRKMTAGAEKGPRLWAIRREREGASEGKGRRSYLMRTKGLKSGSLAGGGKDSDWILWGRWAILHDSTSWEMKLESSFDTSKIYNRHGGGRHPGNSFLYRILRHVFLRSDVLGRLLAIWWSPEAYVFLLKKTMSQRDDRWGVKGWKELFLFLSTHLFKQKWLNSV